MVKCPCCVVCCEARSTTKEKRSNKLHPAPLRGGLLRDHQRAACSLQRRHALASHHSLGGPWRKSKTKKAVMADDADDVLRLAEKMDDAADGVA
jgi:hypothetical protein